jgi:hypothetical protein
MGFFASVRWPEASAGRRDDDVAEVGADLERPGAHLGVERADVGVSLLRPQRHHHAAAPGRPRSAYGRNQRGDVAAAEDGEAEAPASAADTSRVRGYADQASANVAPGVSGRTASKEVGRLHAQILRFALLS